MVLKQFLKSVFDSKDFDFDYEAPNALTGRPSNAFNEDDYDYAIELREHDEYRYGDCQVPVLFFNEYL